LDGHDFSSPVVRMPPLKRGRSLARDAVADARPVARMLGSDAITGKSFFQSKLYTFRYGNNECPARL